MSMHTRQSILAEAVDNSRTLMARYFAGFDDSNHTAQPANLPNHFAWCLGHLALTMSRVAEMLDGQLLSADFFLANSKTGDAQRFGSESVAFASQPASDPKSYPSCARCIAIFNAACDRLVSAIRTASDAALDRTVKWGAGESPVSALIPRMVFHNGVHCGQIADLRRALSMKSVFA